MKARIPYLLAFFALALPIPALRAAAQSDKTGRWANPNDPVAKQLIEAERKWAVLGCEPSNIIAEVLADDFIGTAPSGPTYDKNEELNSDRSAKVRNCKLLSAKVRFFGTDLAIIYGSETSTRTGKDGKEHEEPLIWTDTWLKRNGKWQIIAVQDMKDPKAK